LLNHGYMQFGQQRRDRLCLKNRYDKSYSSIFIWQDEYYAVSVSESQVEGVRNYILNQEEHHRRKTYIQEYNESIQEYNLPVFQDPE